MKKRNVLKLLLIVASAVLVYGAGTLAMAAWSGGSSSRSGGGSQQPTCLASNLTLNLVKADCLKCHMGDDAAQAARHHALIKTQNKPCLDCHQFDAAGRLLPIVTDCIVCHTSAVHDTVTHCVVNTCGGCHPGSLPQIHAGGSAFGGRNSYHSGSYGGSYASANGSVAVCYLCHTSTNPRVQQTIVKGLAGQTVSCSDCHGGGR